MTINYLVDCIFIFMIVFMVVLILILIIASFIDNKSVDKDNK